MQHEPDLARDLAGRCWLCACLAGAGCAEAVPTRSGSELYTAQGCIACHGEQLEGTALGPSLANASARWSTADLVLYLKDPQAYAGSHERLAEQAREYSLPMPRYSMLPEPELAALAEFVLRSR